MGDKEKSEGARIAASAAWFVPEVKGRPPSTGRAGMIYATSASLLIIPTQADSRALEANRPAAWVDVARGWPL